MSIPLELDNIRQSILIDVRRIRNIRDLTSKTRLLQILDVICEYNDFEIVEKTDNGNAITYILANSSHLTIEVFPENRYLALDLFTFREIDTDDIYEKIFEFLMQALDANPLWSSLQIIERKF
jgi:S-adenosylmethionine/arginine decarboxylase-like enzyme